MLYICGVFDIHGQKSVVQIGPSVFSFIFDKKYQYAYSKIAITKF